VPAAAYRAGEAHGQQHQVDVDGEVSAFDRLELGRRAHADAVQLFDMPLAV
jgi:hypothetical protein